MWPQAPATTTKPHLENNWFVLLWLCYGWSCPMPCALYWCCWLPLCAFGAVVVLGWACFTAVVVRRLVVCYRCCYLLQCPCACWGCPLLYDVCCWCCLLLCGCFCWRCLFLCTLYCWCFVLRCDFLLLVLSLAMWFWLLLPAQRTTTKEWHNNRGQCDVYCWCRLLLRFLLLLMSAAVRRCVVKKSLL